MLPLRRTLTALVLLSLVAAACSGGGDAETTTTTSTAATTTTAASTTTASTTTTTSTTPEDTTTVTTYAPDYASPLNGLVATEDILLDRRAIAVKIDNHPQAPPPSRLQSADAVIEILAEGVTRFMAIFHDNDTDYLGPIRSLRPTDSTLAAAIGAPIVISGGQDWIQNLTAGRHVPLIGENTTALFRVASRAAPHNLYGDTTAIRVVADQRGYSNDPPGVLFKIDTWKIPD